MLSNSIINLSPCADAIKWLDNLPNQTNWQLAWDTCPRGDWMLWLLGKQIKSDPWSEDRKPLLDCCLDCAETVKHLWKDANTSYNINILRGWIKGSNTLEESKLAKRELIAAADAAAYAAAYAVADAAAYTAAYAADAAAYTAAYAADAADDAAYAAAYAAYAAYAADAAYAKKQNQKQTADIVRAHFPISPI